MIKKISDLDRAFLQLRLEFLKRQTKARATRKRAAAKRRRIALAAGILLALAIPTYGQGAKWTKEDCRRIEKERAWPGMSPEMAAASEWLQRRSPDNPGGKRLYLENCGQQNAASKKPAAANIIPPAATKASAPTPNFALGLLFLFLGACVYLFPGIIGQNRHHHQRTAIWVLNILLGWTVLGWIAALVWASTATGEQRV